MLIEQTHEIVEKFNRIYGETLILPKAVIPENETQRRLPGVDGKAKMSKSLGNCIYLSDSPKTVRSQVNKKMYTDPMHLQIDDPGHIEGNVVLHIWKLYVIMIYLLNTYLNMLTLKK